MLRVAFVLRSTEVQPEFFWFVHTHKTQNNNNKTATQQQFPFKHSNKKHRLGATDGHAHFTPKILQICPILTFTETGWCFLLSQRIPFHICLFLLWGLPPQRERERERTRDLLIKLVFFIALFAKQSNKNHRLGATNGHSPPLLFLFLFLFLGFPFSFSLSFSFSFSFSGPRKNESAPYPPAPIPP